MTDSITTLFPNFFEWESNLDRNISCIDGNPHWHELDDLVRLAVWRGVKTVFEFGSFIRLTTRVLSDLPDVEKVWTLDIPNGVEPHLPTVPDDRKWLWAARRAPLPDNATQLWGDSATFDFTPYYGKCDLVFVMGAHSLEYIRNDLDHALKMRSEGGLVVWHAGTPGPVAKIGRQYHLYMMGERMALVTEKL